MKTEIEKLKDSLEWAVRELGDGHNIENGERPTHGCEYVVNPEKGHCDWCQSFGEAMELAGILPEDDSNGLEPEYENEDDIPGSE